MGNKSDLRQDFKFFIRSQSLFSRKETLEDKFPRTNVWEAFRFVYDRFPEMRKLNKILKKDRLSPDKEYSQAYLEDRFSTDLNVYALKSEQAILITTYLAMYENLIPILYEDPELSAAKVSSQSYYPAARYPR